MNKHIFFVLTAICLFSSCSKKDGTAKDNSTANKILMLKVDYLTNTFEGGKETGYTTTPSTFTTSTQFTPPSDFGNLKIKYQELNETIFDGDIIWMGKGTIKQPQNILPANQFTHVTTNDIVYPTAGFQNIFNPNNQPYDYHTIWLSVQTLVKVRAYLKSNPNTSVKVFLYTPSVGIGNPVDWDWIFFIKN